MPPTDISGFAENQPFCCTQSESHHGAAQEQSIRVELTNIEIPLQGKWDEFAFTARQSMHFNLHPGSENPSHPGRKTLAILEERP